MSEHEAYYRAFTERLRTPEGLTPDQCRCHGGGWILSDLDTWHQCPDHYTGQRHPEDHDMDDMMIESPTAAPEPQVPPAETDEDDVPF